MRKPAPSKGKHPAAHKGPGCRVVAFPQRARDRVRCAQCSRSDVLREDEDAPEGQPGEFVGVINEIRALWRAERELAEKQGRAKGGGQRRRRGTTGEVVPLFPTSARRRSDPPPARA